MKSHIIRILEFSSKWIRIKIAVSSLMDEDELFQPTNNSIRIQCQHFHLALNLCRYYLEGQKTKKKKKERFRTLIRSQFHKFASANSELNVIQFRDIIIIFQQTQNGKYSNNSGMRGKKLSSDCASCHNGVNNFNYLVSLHYLFIYSCVRFLYLIITLLCVNGHVGIESKPACRGG